MNDRANLKLYYQRKGHVCIDMATLEISLGTSCVDEIVSISETLIISRIDQKISDLETEFASL